MICMIGTAHLAIVSQWRREYVASKSSVHVLPRWSISAEETHVVVVDGAIAFAIGGGLVIRDAPSVAKVPVEWYVRKGSVTVRFHCFAAGSYSIVVRALLS